jgi:alcohol dehydrogenase (cytochrome c)
MPAMDDVPPHPVRRPKISNERNRGEGYAKSAVSSMPYWSSSLLATAGGLVFGGDTNRRIVAFDAASGKILWEVPLNSQPGGFPMTYMAGGKQYVAIPTGLSLIGNRVVRSLTPEIPVPSRGSTLLVFALPDPDSR